jgi:hypothetical protein
MRNIRNIRKNRFETPLVDGISANFALKGISLVFVPGNKKYEPTHHLSLVATRARHVP